MEWLRRSIKRVTKDKLKKNVSKVEWVYSVVLQSNVAHIDYQMNSRNSFPPINHLPSNFIHLKSHKSDCGSLIKTLDYLK